MSEANAKAEKMSLSISLLCTQTDIESFYLHAHIIKYIKYIKIKFCHGQ